MVCRLVQITRVWFLGIILHPRAPNDAGVLNPRCPVLGEELQHLIVIIILVIVEHVRSLALDILPLDAAAKSLQSCLTLCDPRDGSPPGSSVPGILQAIILEWVAISFSNACMLSRFSRVRLCVTPEMAAHQAPPSLGSSRQEHWSGLPFPSPSLDELLSNIFFLCTVLG